MPEDLGTIDSESSVQPPAPSAMTDREHPGISIPTGATPEEQPGIEVTCGGCRRGLRVRWDDLGRFLICQHCGQRFLARSDGGRTGDGGGSEDGSANVLPREGPSPSGPRQGVPADGPDGFAKLAARIRREHRLERSLSDPRGVVPVEVRESRGAGSPFPPRGPSRDRLEGEHDSAPAEVARLRAHLDELLTKLSALEARPSTGAGPADGPSGREEARGDADGDAERRELAASSGRMEVRVRTLEGELDRERAELGAAMIRHRDDRDRLEGALAEAEARRDRDRAGHSGAIERAIREERATLEAEREASRIELDRARSQAAREREALLARVEQATRVADEAGRGREAAVHRAEGLLRERDSSLERSEGLEERGRVLEARLAALEEGAESAAEEAGRLHRDRVDGLSGDLERARGREEAAGGRIASLEGQVEGLQAALDLERGRLAAEQRAWQGDRDDRAARLSEELAEARGREDRDAARLARLEGRVEELLSASRRQAEQAEAAGRDHAAGLDAAGRQAELDRERLEGTIAGLRRESEEAGRGREVERERAAGLAREADELAARLSAVEPALASLRSREAEVARLSAELAGSREEAAAASLRNALLLERLGSPGAGPDARPPGEPVARPLADGPSPSPTGPDRAPGVEVTAGRGEIGREGPIPALDDGPGRRVGDPAEGPSAAGGLVPIPDAGATPGVAMASDRETSRALEGPARGQGREVSIELRGVSKEYRRDAFRIPVLEGLDLTVEEGEFLALMGPSGSGKTTLLNLIAGLDRATSGSVIVRDHDLSGLSEAGLTRWRANNVGFVFQMYNLIPVMTAFRNVELPLLLTRLSRRQRRENAMTALQIVGLGGREDHFPRQLSGGQEQRVSIARAIVTDPYLIVADEPTGDLDRKSADEILDLLGSLNREFRKTIVMVTHDPAAARRASRLLHLDKGRLVGDIFQPRIANARRGATVASRSDDQA